MAQWRLKPVLYSGASFMDPMQIRASASAEDDFSKAFEEYHDAIFRHCCFHVSQREIAREITQETFMKTWEHIAEGNDLDNVRAFLYRVATNLCINYYRKKKSTSLDELQEKGFDPGFEDKALAHDVIEEENVIKVLQHIKEPYRTAVTLRYIEGLSPVEIADITGENANTVSAHISRGLKQLRTEIDHG